MARGVLCALLLALGCAPGRAGEYCHGWTDGARRWHRGFQCPEGSDSAGATLCCGSCSLRFCCSAPESRLDQGGCPAEPLPSPSAPVPVPVYVPFLLVASAFLAFVAGGACVGICCCKRLKCRAEGQQSGLAPGHAWLLEPDLPPRLSSSSCAPGGSVGSAPRGSICATLPPALLQPRFFTPPQLSQPCRALHHHGIPRDHTSGTAPAPFLK
ncbi:SHSA1 protein, partial [Sclerurus mexicanus]|nr:SHSA1 protein [Sclerurus mexicanus]